MDAASEYLEALTFPRAISIPLVIGGLGWAFYLLWVQFAILRYSAGGGLIWLLIWTPGFIAWYGYIRRFFGHFLLGRGWLTWSISLAANLWALLFVISSRWPNPFEHLNAFITASLIWVTFCVIVSCICLRKEGHLRELRPAPPTHVPEDELTRLLEDYKRSHPENQ